jgi:15-cis-phytoene synthase
MQRQLFNNVSVKCSKLVTQTYSTSFSLAVKTLAPSIRDAIYSIYGFVRFADEIVDTFHDHDKEVLIRDFERDYYKGLEEGISLNPILNAFQLTVRKYGIHDELIQAFLQSMKQDLHKLRYTPAEFNRYIYGSAEVVGLMCLKVFVNGDVERYESLREPAMSLGAAFQKVNFLRDLKDDAEVLHRSYFPEINVLNLDQKTKTKIIDEIEEDFKMALEGVKKLPKEARFGVYMAYVYYKSLLHKLKRTPSGEIIKTRVRVSAPHKLGLLAKSFATYKLNLL